jgi:dihydrofolate synthase / folylpolyglutamate synthase
VKSWSLQTGFFIGYSYICGMTYQQTVDYLFTRLPMFSRIGAAAIKADLTNTIKLCGALGDPQHKFKSIHIAGTNGKGSTSHMLAAILQTAGYKTGLYTSPHLHDFRERIKVNGKMVEQEFVVAFTERIQPLIDEIEPSFFEITVAMAFEYFQQQQVDVAIIETGLGGRLDSTNIITPELSVITNIGWDHMQLLGNTLEQIASEKAGIIKRNIPVVIGETQNDTNEVFRKKATELNAPIVFADDMKYVDEFAFEEGYLRIIVDDRRKNEKPLYHLDLTGLYQTKNLLTVLEAAHQLQLKDWQIEEWHLKEALKHVKKLTGLHGRWETIHHQPKVILDVAHNVDGMKLVMEQLEFETFNHLYIIIGMVKDKEIEAVLQLLPSYASYYFTKAQIPRALDEMELMQKAAQFNLKGKAIPEVNVALQDVLAHAKQDDLILICGSVFVVAEVKL